jgi:hypothetical protein
VNPGNSGVGLIGGYPGRSVMRADDERLHEVLNGYNRSPVEKAPLRQKARPCFVPWPR